MSSTSTPYGFIPIRHPSGQNRARPYTIATTYATAIGKGDAVILNTDGTLNIGTATNDIIGIFDGVEYIDANGVPTKSPNWPAAGVGTSIVAWVWDDPSTEFRVQADGAIALTAVGAQADMVAGTVNTTTGLSAQVLNSTIEAGGAQGQFTILELFPAVNNAWGDTYTEVIVKIAQHQYVSNKVGI